MDTLYGPDVNPRRQMNLGGVSSSSSHIAVLDRAKALRAQRQAARRQEENAQRIQRWWRGNKEAMLVRESVKRIYDEDTWVDGGITKMRCLVLMGRDEERLARWSSDMLKGSNGGNGQLLVNPTFPSPTLYESWSRLLRRTSLILLQAVSTNPTSEYAVSHLQLLIILATTPTIDITPYMLKNGLYKYLSTAICNMSVQQKSAPALPMIVNLLLIPLGVFPKDSLDYSYSVYGLFRHVLTAPLLPNRLPLSSLTQFSGQLPLASLPLLNTQIHALIGEVTLEERVHLLANLLAFSAVRYAKLPSPSLKSLLLLYTDILNNIPPNALEATTEAPLSSSWAESDDEDHAASSAPFALPLDPKTRTRLDTLITAQHINDLSAATSRHASTKEQFFFFVFALCSHWPARRVKIFTSLVAVVGGGFVRELYRGYVRRSPLGKADDLKSLLSPSNAASWPTLLLLTELYSHSLLTMGDDEFFSTSASAGHRNPLSLDELISFSRQLLNIAFSLYWNEGNVGVRDGFVPGVPNVNWEAVREKVTTCLLAIHARDSRRPFTPPDHWLLSSHLDMDSFVQVAANDERSLSEEDRPTRLLSKREMTYVSPRLGILNNIPFAIPFETRVTIFRHFVLNDMASRGGRDRFDRRYRTSAVIHRGSVAKDGFDKLNSADLKGAIEIIFIDQFGQQEAGIDGGGVFKEFFTELCKEVFDTDRGLWLATKQNELYPNPHSYAKEKHSLDWYRFIGRILGKALYEGILIDVAFAGFFLAKWLGKQSYLDDLASLDPELYNGLVFLKHYQENPEDLSLNFTIAEDEFGVTRSVDLIPNGSNIPVTRENRLEYIHRVSHYRLTRQIQKQSEAFFEGLSDIIDPKWLRMFNQQEVQILIGGVDTPIDLEDLRRSTNYGGLYDDDEPTIQAFWKVVNSFTQEQKRGLLRFATSCSRPPLLGFKELQPRFSIRDSGSDQLRLPTASTCVNLLKLPRYSSEGVLRSKLLQAINSGAGFDLS